MQLRAKSRSWALFASGCLCFQIGFVKKVLVADAIAPLAVAGYGLTDPTFSESWLGTLAYAFQIYFDFSGYSDMAIGLGMMLGFSFPVNFDAPYISKSITEFWRRWHISLSTWLRDYLYIPLGGNRHGPARMYFALLMTMLLGGLWHGAAWTYIAWGAYQGGFLVIERLNGKRTFYKPLPGVAQIAITFVLACIGWVFFRAKTMGQAGEFITSMLGAKGVEIAWGRLDPSPTTLWAMLAAALIIWGIKPTHVHLKNPGLVVRIVIPLLFLVAVGHLFFQQYRPFLYFQF